MESVDKLRDMARRVDAQSDGCYTEVMLGEDVRCPSDGGCDACYSRTAKMLMGMADEIEAEHVDLLNERIEINIETVRELDALKERMSPIMEAMQEQEPALAADGLPIVEGETVYDAVSGKAGTVNREPRATTNHDAHFGTPARVVETMRVADATCHLNDCSGCALRHGICSVFYDEAEALEWLEAEA